jgi:hypothetical protein
LPAVIYRLMKAAKAARRSEVGIFKKAPVGLPPDTRAVEAMLPANYQEWMVDQTKMKFAVNAGRIARAQAALGAAKQAHVQALAAAQGIAQCDSRGCAVVGPAVITARAVALAAWRALEGAQREMVHADMERRDLQLTLHRAEAGIADAIQVLKEVVDRFGNETGIVPSDHPGLRPGSHDLASVQHSLFPDRVWHATGPEDRPATELPPNVTIRTQEQIDAAVAEQAKQPRRRAGRGSDGA